ncbi:MAG: ribonuclease E/G, partial [Proteobacteria bacterium]|nr:ribonuclease E/G [Pseudomonadota bacterium]
IADGWRGITDAADAAGESQRAAMIPNPEEDPATIAAQKAADRRSQILREEQAVAEQIFAEQERLSVLTQEAHDAAQAEREATLEELQAKATMTADAMTSAFQTFFEATASGFKDSEGVWGAAAEAARQIRLRNISGLIVVDFVPVRDPGHKAEVLGALRAAVAGDPLGPQVIGYTAMGLVEMTRRRHGPSLQEILCLAFEDRAGPSKSPLTVALAALRGVLREGQGASVPLTLRAPPAVIEALRGPAKAALKEAEQRLGLAITAVADQTFAAEGWEIVPAKDP